MHQQVGPRRGAAVGQRHRLGTQSVQADAAVLVLAEHQRLAMLQVDEVVRLDTAVGCVFKDAVVEDFAVLINLHKGRTAVGRRPPQRLRQVVDVHVDGAGHERGLGGHGQRQRPQRPVHRPLRVGACARAGPRGRRVLPLGQAHHFVVEKENFDIHIAAQGVDEVVAADGQAVAVAGHDPDVQLGPDQLQARGHGRRPAVEGLEAVGVEVVRQPARTADAGDEHQPFARHAQRRQHLLEHGQDREVAAAGAPAHLLVAGQVFGGQGRDRRRGHAMLFPGGGPTLESVCSHGAGCGGGTARLTPPARSIATSTTKCPAPRCTRRWRP